jgi:hypothetical protein
MDGTGTALVMQCGLKKRSLPGPLSHFGFTGRGESSRRGFQASVSWRTDHTVLYSTTGKSGRQYLLVLPSLPIDNNKTTKRLGQRRQQFLYLPNRQVCPLT